MQEEPKINVWITKYALTEGIYGTMATVCLNVNTTGNMIAVKSTNRIVEQYFHGKGKQWTDSFEEAVKFAEKMREKKIASIRKQINKLEKLDFNRMK